MCVYNMMLSETLQLKAIYLEKQVPRYVIQQHLVLQKCTPYWSMPENPHFPALFDLSFAQYIQ